MKSFRKFVLIISLLIFLISTISLLKLLVIDPWKNQNINNKIREIYMKGNDTNQEQFDKFKALKEINNNIIGWIQIENTAIDYPVVVSPKNNKDYYLKHDFEKKPSAYGTIFVIREDDILNESCKNICIHGHHMKNGSMFANILKFSDLEFYKRTPLITFETINENAQWKVFSVFKINTLEKHGKLFNYLVSKFSSNKSFTKYIDEVKKRSLLNIPVEVSENDKLLTLSTCSYEFPEFRTVVVARKIRENENPEVDVLEAKEATNPLMPDVYLTNKKTARPYS